MLSKKVLEILGKSKDNYKFIPDKELRPFHDRRYAINVDKLKATGWKHWFSLDEGLKETVNWYKNNSWWLN